LEHRRAAEPAGHRASSGRRAKARMAIATDRLNGSVGVSRGWAGLRLLDDIKPP